MFVQHLSFGFVIFLSFGRHFRTFGDLESSKNCALRPVQSELLGHSKMMRPVHWESLGPSKPLHPVHLGPLGLSKTLRPQSLWATRKGCAQHARRHRGARSCHAEWTWSRWGAQKRCAQLARSQWAVGQCRGNAAKLEAAGTMLGQCWDNAGTILARSRWGAGQCCAQCSRTTEENGAPGTLGATRALESLAHRACRIGKTVRRNCAEKLYYEQAVVTTSPSITLYSAELHVGGGILVHKHSYTLLVESSGRPSGGFDSIWHQTKGLVDVDTWNWYICRLQEFNTANTRRVHDFTAR
jgi:hypothetical protein